MDATRLGSENTGGHGSLKAAGGTKTTGIVSAPSAGSPDQNMDELLKRLMKFKHLEVDNKKLKSLLK